MLEPIGCLDRLIVVCERTAGLSAIVSEIDLVLLTAMVGRDDDQRSVGEPAFVKGVEDAAELLVRDPQHVGEVILAWHALQAASLVLSEHVRDLVDAAERQKHAGPCLAVDDLDRGVRGPRVAAEASRIVSWHVPAAVEL